MDNTKKNYLLLKYWLIGVHTFKTYVVNLQDVKISVVLYLKTLLFVFLGFFLHIFAKNITAIDFVSTGRL